MSFDVAAQAYGRFMGRYSEQLVTPMLDPHFEGIPDALDAVICAIVAGAVLLGRTAGPPDDVPADEEGWIHLPDAAFLRTGPASVTDS